MKKFFAIVAFSGFTVAAASAQSTDVPSFRSDEEKKAWLEANPGHAAVQAQKRYAPARQKIDNARYEASRQRAVSAKEAHTFEGQAERELMKQRQIDARQINARQAIEANEAKKAEAIQARLSSSVTAEERDALIAKYEALIRENEGRDGFNRNAYEARIESLRNADIK